MSFRRLMGGVAIVALASVCAVQAQAQETTGDIRGQVTSPSGAPVAGASVTVIHAPSNSASTATTDANGGFSARGLRVGGPYTVLVSGGGYAPQQVEGVTVNLGSTTTVPVTLSGSAGAVDTIVITAAATGAANLAIGPSMSFSLADLQTSPSVNRDLKDIVRMDPRIYLDESFSDSIQCAGAHPRFNSLTVDGVAMNDGFGLNSNGYPTERMPFPFDAISQVSVELAPYDVEYGGFTACNINAVTKSGDNEFHGGIFFDYTDDSLRGDSIEGQDVFVAEFDEKRYGASIGGPIIPDRLFFFAAYEKFEGVNQFFRGPAGSGMTNEIAGLSQANYDRIVQISNTVYGYDPGGTPQPSPAEDEKYLVRLDWNITDRHRAAFTYNHNEGLNLTESDQNQATQFEFGKHLYNRGAVLEAYSAQIFSDWTDAFSTEVRVGYNDVDFTQACVDGQNVGEVGIRLGATTVFLGCDDSRHSNDLDYTVFNAKLAGSYAWNNHELTVGVETSTNDIFNLFIQHTEGEFVFSGANPTAAIDSFQAGQPSQIVYGNARGTNNPADAGATFAYTTNTAYVQDEVALNDYVNLTAGVRYDWYVSEDEPLLNPFFTARNGFENTFNLDGIGLLQPRLGVTWDVTDALTLRGGVGLFSGGNPNVWISNSYSNDGILNAQFTNNAPANILTAPNTGDERGANQTVNPNGALWGVPTSMFNQVAAPATSDTTVNAIDPEFDVPSEWKLSLGATWNFDLPGMWGQGYVVNADFLRSQSESSAIIKDISLEQIGTAPDGRPIYKRIDRADPDCLTNPAGAACASRGNNNDLLLTNSDGGQQDVYSVSLQKAYDSLGIDWSLAYAFVESEDRSSMTSSVAFSNFTANAVSDINDPSVATSAYEIPHRFTGSVSWEHAFFGDFMSRATLFGQHFQNRPYSFTYTAAPTGFSSNGMFGDGVQTNHLLYVPTGATDPNVIFCNGVATPGFTPATDPCANRSSAGAPNGTYANFNTTAFFNYVDFYGLERGQISERNSFDGQWTSKIDLKLEQEFPTGYGRGAGYVVFENLGNMVNDEWGVFYQAPFPQRTGIVDATLAPGNTRYAFRNFTNVAPETRVGDSSFWTVRLGVKYEF